MRDMEVPHFPVQHFWNVRVFVFICDDQAVLGNREPYAVTFLDEVDDEADRQER